MMEDDDEFGDLYTDVLKPFPTSSSSSAPHPNNPSPTPQLIHRPIDLNFQSDGRDEILFSPSNPQTLIPNPPDQKHHNSAASAPLPPPLTRVLNDSKSPNDVVQEVNFDIEDDLTAAPIIPGISKPDVSGGGGGEGDDWEEESDSDDDLQIVLNDKNHGGAMAMMERGGVMDGGDDDDDDDDDEDGEPLVIVTDEVPNQGLGEEQEWGEDTGQTADGERKEGGEAVGKPNGGGGGSGIVIPPKLGYSNHVYHPYHSQFKVSSVVVVVVDVILCC